jgi:pantoate--beta-alanine ligase
MSSRNQLLSEKDKEDASLIFKTLEEAKNKKKEMSPSKLSKWAGEKLSSHPAIDVEYFKIINARDLKPAKKWESSEEQVACVAVKINNVRLIDNMIFP